MSRRPSWTTVRNLARDPKVQGRFATPYFAVSNRLVRQRITGNADVVVCLTSYGRRTTRVQNAIESIARGSVRPRRFVLWLDNDELVARPTKALRRLRDRGLEIRSTPNYYPHKKYYPYAALHRKHEVPLVTADDDVAYPRWWLERLLQSHARDPEAVWCYRAHRITLDSRGQIAPYDQWVPCQSTVPSFLNVPTGTSGVLYPPALLDELARLGTAFMDDARDADDLWLHRAALRSDVMARQVFARPLHFPLFPYDQRNSLMHANKDQGGNDRVIARIYTDSDRAKLLKCATGESTRP